MKKVIVLSLFSLLTIVSFVSSSASSVNQNFLHNSTTLECLMPNNEPSLRLLNTHDGPESVNIFRQVSQAQNQEDERRCERPDSQNPDVGYRDPNKIGCKCMRKPPCDEKGYPSENYETPETRCKKHCKKDKCDCPNPCKP